PLHSARTWIHFLSLTIRVLLPPSRQKPAFASLAVPTSRMRSRPRLTSRPLLHWRHHSALLPRSITENSKAYLFITSHYMAPPPRHQESTSRNLCSEFGALYIILEGVLFLALARLEALIPHTD